MSGIFNVENKFFSMMGKVWDLALLSMAWLALSTYCFFILISVVPESMQGIGILIASVIQGITLGPATTGLYYAVVKVIRKDRGYTFREFFRSFKSNFKQAAVIAEIYLLIVYILRIDYQYANSLIKNGSNFGMIYQIGANAITIILIVTLVYIFAVLSRFTLGLKEIFKTALLMGVRHLPTTIILALILGVSLFGVFIMPPLMLVVPSVCCLLMSFLIERVFKKYMPKSEGNPEETGKDEWYLE